jgi:phosphate transport system protein
MTTRKVFTEEMEELDKEVTTMATLAVKTIEKAIKAFEDLDMELAKEVDSLEDEIFCWDIRIEKHCTDIIALHAPVAGDLRTITTCMKIITDLQRIGKYAHNIGVFAKELNGLGHFKRMVSIPHQGELMVEMVNDAVNSYIHRNVDEARRLYDKDDEVDHLWNSILRETLTYMIEKPDRTTVGTYYILVARYLERIADHSVNIGERVAYMVTGKRIKSRDWTQICADMQVNNGM